MPTILSSETIAYISKYLPLNCFFSQSQIRASTCSADKSEYPYSCNSETSSFLKFLKNTITHPLLYRKFRLCFTKAQGKAHTPKVEHILRLPPGGNCRANARLKESACRIKCAQIPMSRRLPRELCRRQIRRRLAASPHRREAHVTSVQKQPPSRVSAPHSHFSL